MLLTLRLVLSHLQTHFLSYLLAFGVGVGAYYLGQSAGRAQLQGDLTKARNTIGQLAADKSALNETLRQQAELRALAMAKVLRELQAVQQLGDKLSRELKQSQSNLQATKDKLKKAIDDAVKNDVGFTGIGPRGLCLYNAALGYADCGQHMPNTAGGLTDHSTEAAGSAGGLSAGGLIRHSADYGAWCQSLEAQLQQLNQWYAGREQ
ncbi:hypothetical protein SMKC057_16450 [Serratia marcescens]|nr:hypothetical protein SMKC057_16450 [Serratia marcescens]